MITCTVIIFFLDGLFFSASLSVRKFFQILPEALKKFDIEILNDKKEVKIDKSYHSWQSICKRAPNYFEIMLNGKPAKEYQSAVFNQLYMIFPKPGSTDMKSKVLTFIRRLDGVAMPIIMY